MIPTILFILALSSYVRFTYFKTALPIALLIEASLQLSKAVTKGVQEMDMLNEIPLLRLIGYFASFFVLINTLDHMLAYYINHQATFLETQLNDPVENSAVDNAPKMN